MTLVCAGSRSPSATERNIGPMSEEEGEAREREFVQRAYRTGRIGPLVGIVQVVKLLGIDRMTLRRWMQPGSGSLGPDRTRMIPPARIGGGEHYAAALHRRAAVMRAEGHDRDAIITVEAAALEAEESEGRPVWVLEDVLRFAPERIRAPAGRAKPRGKAKG